MNTHIGSRLKAAAQAGNIDLLYTVIQDDPSILEDIDLMPFIETPLHIAASLGHLQFATEIMRLKPSFALKLNPQGFSPIHLAMHNDQWKMVYRFVDLNKDLVRVQGKEGMTPLHIASEIGEIDLLTIFLILCPESIEYLNVRRETALHIAVKNDQYDALQVLVGWLKVNDQRGAQKLENDILNQKDEAGNTILHISALRNEPQALKLLVKRSSINLNEKNLENKTPLDMATTPGMKTILLSVGAKSSSEVGVVPTVARVLIRPNNRIIIWNKWLGDQFRISADVTVEERNTWLIVATLIATAMYGSILSPPGGVYQISVGDNNLNNTSSNSTLPTFEFPGSSVLPPDIFYTFSVLNMLSFTAAITIIFILIPVGDGLVSSLVYCPIVLFYVSYLFSMNWITPGDADYTVLLVACFLTLLVGLGYICLFILDHFSVRQIWKRNVKKLSI